MQIQITGHHIEVTPAMHSYIKTKFERLERHFDHAGDAHVILTVQKLLQKAEATIQIPRATIFADAEAEDMYAAIDELIDKLDRQIKKHKEKSTEYRATGENPK